MSAIHKCPGPTAAISGKNGESHIRKCIAMSISTLNRDCLSRNAREGAMGKAPEYSIRQRSSGSSLSRGKPGTWRSGTVYT